MTYIRTAPRLVTVLLLMMLLAGTSGCRTVVSGITASFAQDLSDAILNSNDIAMVRDGAPAYLILVDSLVARSPEDGTMLQQSAALHSAYAAAFVADEDRAKRLHTKARRQALDGTCLLLDDACRLESIKFAEFEAWLETLDVRDVPVVYSLATAWAGWIQANSDDFSAIAELARVKALLVRASELDPDYENGSIFLYLGVFETLLPPAMGGKPELGRSYFEDAIRRSDNKNLLAKVMFAEQYARLVFDRELHDQLLQEVLAADPGQPGMTLMNIVAQEQAQQLLDTANDYF